MKLEIIMKTMLLSAIALFSATANAQTDSLETGEPRVKWHIDAVSEGQWNMKSGRTNWANMLSAGMEVRTWRGGSIEFGALATGLLKDGIVDDLQDLSNINAESRAFRLTHLGIGQLFFGKLYVYAGLREADEDYFNTDGAGIFTGSSYGCVPQAGENLAIGVYPEAAPGLHIEYRPTEAWTLSTTLYNGKASDRLNRQFRFRPGRDGMVNIGSVSFSPTFSRFLDSNGETAEGFLAPTYVIGYAAGWQYIENETEGYAMENLAPSTARRNGGALWASIDQPLTRVGRAGLNLFATGGMRIGQTDNARGHWAAALMLGNVTSSGGTLAMGVSQAHYAENMKETDFETTFEYPILSWLSLQPALHIIRTDGKTNVAANLRLAISLGNNKMLGVMK